MALDLLEQDYVELEVAACRPHPLNPNIGDEDALAASVDASGFYGAITVRPHPDEADAYQILAGEHRWRLAARRGATAIPAIVLTDCDDVRAVRILLADNEVARRGSYNKDALDKALDSLGDLSGSGFDSVLDAAGAAHDEATAAEDAAAEDAYHDDSDDEDVFEREYGILVMAESELDQSAKFEELAKMFGASSLRVVSV